MHRSPPDGSLPRRRRLLGQLARPRTLGLLGVLACAGAAMLPTGAAVDRTSSASAAPANAATGPGNGFTVTAGDLMFILKNIKIAERHAAAFEGDANAAAQPNPDTLGDPNYCQAQLGSAVDQVPDPLTSYGLRTVDGTCNNLVKNSPALDKRDRFGASDQVFPRLTKQNYRAAENIPAGFFCPNGAPGCPPGGVPAVDTPSTYANHVPGNVVVDTQPRLISNLIVDQTSTNPAAVDVAANPARTQANPDRVFACTADPPAPTDPAGCTPLHHTLFIPNVSTDVGLSPPFNSLFTFFGQFFDHGVDQTVKSDGTVFVPLRPDDPLLQPGGADGNPATPGDQANPQSAFIAITRATVKRGPGPDGILGNADDTYDAFNTDTPWVDQSQTYTSHPSHQFFLREYDLVGGKPVPTGKFLGGLPAGQTYAGNVAAGTGASPDGTDGMSTWASTKLQAATKLGMQLVDRDVTNIPMIAMDPYGNFIPAPASDPNPGMPQFVCSGPCINPDTNAVEGANNMVSGNIASPVKVPTNALHFDTPFLTDIAHNADPSPQDTDNNPATPPVAPVPDNDGTDAAGNEIHTPSADFAAQPPGTYDDEMLNAHFTCGDGRCNENIALSSIHTIFHSEHNRLVDDITNTLNANPSLLADYQAPHLLAPGDDVSFGFGGRLFQAARFVTEMEYQHLVFEEFARKVVPAIHPFHVYATDVNPAIDAEFAHAMYRFGHSMLDDTVARDSTIHNADGSTTLKDNSLPLLTAFLNPPEFFDNAADPANPVYTPRQAVGAVVMGSVDQTGNEIDEFVTETLRNNLLGLPLDLAAINMARARSEGIPPLNEVRREINATTHDASLAPYTSWSDYGQHLKHPQSLVNFVAAYGTHPTILAQSTIAGRRAAARAIVDPQPGDVQPADAADFMFSTGTWASGANGVTTTGLDSVDLWVGGLAEVTNLNGGMLGSTFNYVFQTQLEKLQDNDRFYYLNRTPGMNLRSQLEGNSFAEMIMRNTDDVNALKKDVFARADCKFQLGDIQPGPATAPVPQTVPPTLFGAGSVADDPATTDCNENQLLLLKPDGTVQYRSRNSVNPPGINGQSVYYGTDGVDRIIGGNDNDTFWGGNGADRIEGNGGDDVLLGGNGDDILTDLDGADILEGGPGNDAIDAGPGDDITIGNDGQDFIQNGMNDNETFAGPGNDFIESGAGADAPFGGGGDDWMEGGSGQDILAGDHEAPFFDDPGEVKPGNDIFIGQVGENDYDAEGGDDIMEQNPAIERNAGAAGFDWAIHQTDTKAADDDMMINNNLLGLALPVVVNRDRWQETEADSGSDNFSDVIKGTDLERIVGPAGFSGCDALDQAGVDRIAGLNHYISTFPTKLADVIAASAMKRCPLTGSGPTADGVWAEGDILMGGGKSDNLAGRSNDDIIDGDHSLNVYISVRSGFDPVTNTPTGPEIARTDLMEDPALSGSFGLGATPNMTLEQAVASQIVDPGQLQAVREIHDIPAPGAAQGTLLDPNANVTPNTNRASTCSPADLGITNSDVPSLTANCDIAEYRTGPETLVVTNNANGSTTVTDPVSVAAVAAAPGIPTAKGEGIDTLWNIEALRFCVANDPVNKKICVQWQTFAINDPAISGSGGPANPLALGGSPRAFGSLAVGTGPASQAIVIRNAGGGFFTAGTATITGLNAADFTITTDGCDTLVLGGGGTCSITVGFSPAAAGARTATLTVPTDAGNVTVTLNGTGTAVATAAQATIAKPASFGTRRIGDPLVTKAVPVRNDGNANLTIGSATSSTSAFTVDLGTCNVPLAPTKTCKLNVTFVPAAPIGPKNATLTVVSNASNSPTTVALTGTSKEAAVVVGALRIVQPAAPTSVKPVNVSLHVSTAAAIRLQVRNAKGRLVWSKSAKAIRAGTAKLRWNLRDSKGHRVKKGKYVFTITVVDNTGFRVVVKRTVRVR